MGYSAMASNPVQPVGPASYEPRVHRTESQPEASNGTRDVAQQTRNVQEGNVTAPERVSPDIKKEAIDSRKRGAPTRHKRLDAKA